jgi:hypothetical protein
MSRILRAEELEVRVSLPRPRAAPGAALRGRGGDRPRIHHDAVLVDLRVRPDVVERLRQEGVVVRVAS